MPPEMYQDMSAERPPEMPPERPPEMPREMSQEMPEQLSEAPNREPSRAPTEGIEDRDDSASVLRARELTRGRPRRPAVPDTGRRHHIGAAPEYLTVLLPDGSTGTTRTSPGQLADRTRHQLTQLRDRIERDMARAAGALDFELAAHLRDEADTVRRELERRG
jgi:hypothetical protein